MHRSGHRLYTGSPPPRFPWSAHDVSSTAYPQPPARPDRGIRLRGDGRGTGALEGAGAALTDVAKTTVYVASTQQQDLVTVWSVYREYMGSHDVPSTLLGVTVLGYRDQLVEVEAVAVLRPAR